LITNLSIKEYLEIIRNIPTLDVRSPLEYEHAHIPGAINLSLLNNEERKIIGTTYKNSGNQSAVIQGYQLVGPKFSQYIENALKISPDKIINVYCWRGGLRSNIMAFILHTAGFKVNLLIGGYKAFRNWTSDSLSEERKIKIIGGKTGSGKTLIIEQLRKMEEQVINLESLANHRGSAFGSMGQSAQVSNEQFENLLVMEWKDLNSSKTLWLENESRTIGSNVIPLPIFNQMQKAITFDVQIPLEERVNYIVKEYGCFNYTDLANNTSKLQKRLGNLRLNQALDFLSNGLIREWSILMLEYYDKTYIYGNSKRELGTVIPMVFDKLNVEEMTIKILQWEKQND
jgi:tRNA 2-selenouridine synthase